MLRLNWNVGKDANNNFKQRKKEERNHMNHRTTLTPLTFSLSSSFIATYYIQTKTLFNLIGFAKEQRSALISLLFFRKKNQQNRLSEFILSGHQSTWIELHAKTKHQETERYSLRFGLRYLHSGSLSIYSLLRKTRFRWTDSNLLSFFIFHYFHSSFVVCYFCPFFDKFCPNDLAKKE